jgi:PAS domain S-box-containing protein
METIQGVLEASPDAVLIVDSEGIIRRANRNVPDVLGYDSQELEGVVVEELLFEADRDSHVAFRQEYMDSPEPRPMGRETDLYALHKSGTAVPVQISLGPIEHGGEIHVVATIADLTKQKRRQRELERYERIITQLPVGVFRTRSDGDIVEVNPAVISRLDADSRTDLIGRNIRTLFADPTHCEEVLGRLASEGIVNDEHLELETLTGETLWISVTMTRVQEDDETYIEGVAQDITNRKNQEQLLREEYAFNQVALESAIDFYWTLDLDGVIVDWSDEDGSVTGYSAAEAIGMHATAVFPEDEKAYIERKVAELRDQGTVTAEARFLTKDGREIPYRFDGTVLTDSEGNVVRLCGLGRDVSEQKRRERELERQNERLEQFVSVVSHDLRNPLNVAHGHAEFAREECESDRLTAVIDALDRCETLVDDLLTLARQGHQAVETEAVSYPSIVKNCWKNVSTDDSVLHVEVDGTIEADRSRLQQLLENLFRNAVEHGGDGVTVTVGALEDGFYVADDGDGIDGDRERIFEAGYSTTREGTGFGLNIVKEVVEAHGWSVDVTESACGGARFEITEVNSTSSHG